MPSFFPSLTQTCQGVSKSSWENRITRCFSPCKNVWNHTFFKTRIFHKVSEDPLHLLDRLEYYHYCCYPTSNQALPIPEIHMNQPAETTPARILETSNSQGEFHYTSTNPGKLFGNTFHPCTYTHTHTHGRSTPTVHLSSRPKTPLPMHKPTSDISETCNTEIVLSSLHRVPRVRDTTDLSHR